MLKESAADRPGKPSAARPQSSVVGVDIGGTFTDLVGYRDGVIVTSKTSTVPADPTEGITEALKLAECDLAAMDELIHGSTIAINTVLEHKGAKTALVTTAGMRDVYAIGRGNRPDAFNLFFHRPRPLVPRELTFELAERMNAAGKVLQPLDPAEIAALAQKLGGLGVEAVAVCLLHAYGNPAHEILAGETLRRALPGVFITLSHEILREFREYERTSTTVLNAFVGPRVSRYLSQLEEFADKSRFAGQIAIMRSNGGTMSAGEARRAPVAMMESGPVAGMIGAGRIAQILGIERAIGFDMGGTTAKTSLITDGVAPIEEGYIIGDAFTGQPMQLPVVDIVEVGTGGGSIAWCDEHGGLHVGPHSSGADPGPACYGRGGTEPTVTDADLLLGRLNDTRFLGGHMRLDRARAHSRRCCTRQEARPRRYADGARHRHHLRCRHVACGPRRIGQTRHRPARYDDDRVRRRRPAARRGHRPRNFYSESHHSKIAGRVLGARHADGRVASGFCAHADRRIGQGQSGKCDSGLFRTARRRRKGARARWFA